MDQKLTRDTGTSAGLVLGWICADCKASCGLAHDGYRADVVSVAQAAANWTCPNCGGSNPIENRRCFCGRLTDGPIHAAAAAGAPGKVFSRPKAPLWLAAFPPVIAACFMINSLVQFHRVGQVIGAGSGDAAASSSKSNGPSCVDTYNVTLTNSFDYVPSGSAIPIFVASAPGTTREISTVLRGMALNKCSDPVADVRLNITVRDEKGSRGTGSFEFSKLKPGVVETFERAWMGRVASFEITSNR